MRNIIVIPEAGAIPGALQICGGLLEHEVYLFDPQVGDPAAVAGLHGVRLFTDTGGPAYAELDREAHAEAARWEEQLDAVQRRYDTGVSIAGWQHLGLYYLIMALRWYGGLWPRIDVDFGQGNLILLINRNPAEYYLPSFVPTAMLLAHLKEKGIHFTAYDYGDPVEVTHCVPDFKGAFTGDGGLHMLTHLPTCFYDAEYFAAEIRASGRSVINLSARRWNVPVQADHQIGLTVTERVIETLEPRRRSLVEDFTTALTATLDELLTPSLSLAHYRRRQVEHLAHTYRSQLVAYLELERFFDGNPPVKLLLSEHDAGLHGPLVAFAARHSLPVVMLPHSKVSADLEFHYDNITVCTHPIQGTPIHNGRGRPVDNPRLAYPETFTGSSDSGKGLRSISLMLNSVSLNGIPFSPIEVYLDGIRRIIDWCRSRSVALKIRGKPGHTITGLLSVYLRLDAAELSRMVLEDIDEHLRECDVCLMYDLATTAVLHALRRSVPVLNPLVSEQTPAQLAVVHARVVPPESVDQTLRRLDAFHADPFMLDSFRAAQFRAYIDGFLDARALRNYL